MPVASGRLLVWLALLVALSTNACFVDRSKQRREAAAIADVVATGIANHFSEHQVYPETLFEVAEFPFELKCNPYTDFSDRPDCGGMYMIRGLDGSFLNGKSYIELGANEIDPTTVTNSRLRYGFHMAFKDTTCWYEFTVAGEILKNCHDRTPRGFRQ